MNMRIVTRIIADTCLVCFLCAANCQAGLLDKVSSAVSSVKAKAANAVDSAKKKAASVVGDIKAKLPGSKVKELAEQAVGQAKGVVTDAAKVVGKEAQKGAAVLASVAGEQAGRIANAAVGQAAQVLSGVGGAAVDFGKAALGAIGMQLLRGGRVPTITGEHAAEIEQTCSDTETIRRTRYVDLSGMAITDEQVEYVAVMLYQMAEHGITSITLNLASNDFTAAGLEMLLQVMLENPGLVTGLGLANNDLGDEGPALLAAVIADGLPIAFVVLTNTRLDDARARVILEAVATANHPVLRHVIMTGNPGIRERQTSEFAQNLQAGGRLVVRIPSSVAGSTVRRTTS
ncbi:MAG: hypothetical protein LBJ69_00335 [Holosporales bacterium]|nr:hypothetical protein [Holosporales bacterium]